MALSTPIALILALTLSGLATPQAEARTQDPIKWSTCAEDVLKAVPAALRDKVTCAQHKVPLDHQDPQRGTISLSLLKRPAADQSRRIGSLFLNPGGPGGSGLVYPAYGESLFRPEVLRRFDLIGFDPRGVARSTPLKCFRTKEDADAVFNRLSVVPITDREVREAIDATEDYTDSCGKVAGPLLDHMSTEDVARDLDLLRQAVGDRQLTYVGFSYGTLLGATYANLFPSRSRALILDGNVDPTLRTRDGAEYDRQRAQGFELALDAFLKRCAQEGPKCAFSANDPRAKFDAARDALRTRSVTLPSQEVVTYTSYVGTVTGALYSPNRFKDLATWLQAVHAALDPGVASVPAAVPDLGPNRGRYDVRVGVGDAEYLSDDSYYGVNCTDKPFSTGTRQFPRIAKQWERESPTFGRQQAASDLLTCPSWPLDEPDRYSGPWNRRTPHPVLVVGNYYDPATQYRFSRRMAAQLGNARLVGVDAFGHCILGDSAGVDAVAADYLVDLKVPAAGLVFRPDVQPF